MEQLSQLNQAYINNQFLKPAQSQNILPPPPQEPKKDGHKKLALALVGIGVIAAAGVAIYKHKNPAEVLENLDFDKGIASLKNNGEKFTGTVKDTLKNGDKITMKYENGILQSSKRMGAANISKTYDTINGDKIVKIIKNGNEEVTKNISQKIAQGKIKALDKTFRDVDGKLVEGVTLNKGKALLKDGSGFSGVMRTVNKKGEKIALEYTDGFITQSKRNGRTIKEYSELDCGIPRNRGCLIGEYTPHGYKKTEILKHDNGKIAQIMDYKNGKLTEFSKNGKKLAEIQNFYDSYPTGKIFNENGTLKKELVHDKPFSKIVKHYDKDGTLLYETAGGVHTVRADDITGKTTEELINRRLYSNADVKNPNSVSFFKKDGSPDILLGCEKGDELTKEFPDNRQWSFSITRNDLKPASEVKKNPTTGCHAVSYTDAAGNGVNPLMICGDKIYYDKNLSPESWTKQMVQDAVNNLQDGLKKAELTKMNLKYKDKYLEVIQRLKQYAETIK